MPDLFDVMLRQRACRRFDPERDVDDGAVGRMLTAATHAPSGENRQPWAFVVVRDPSIRAALAAITDRAWREFVRDHVETQRDESPLLVEDVRAGMEGGFAAAPVVVVACADTQRNDLRQCVQAVYPAVQNLLLAAGGLGLGSCLTTLTALFADELRPLLDLPPHAVPLATVYLGHPAKRLGRPRRRPLAEVAHRDRWGTPW